MCSSDLLHLITGRAGAGKTRLLTEALAAHMRRGERAILIVPEQHTFEAERRVAEAAGGLFGVQVLSLERLSERVLHTAGERRTFLTEQGVRMVVRRAALHRQQSLRAFSHVARANGFAGEIAALIAACKQAGITPEMLHGAAAALPEDSLLSEKLADTALLYADVEAYLSERYLTENDLYAAAAALLPGSFAGGVPIYLDGLPAVTRQVLSFLETLLGAAQSLTVALTLDEQSPDADVFAPNADACAALRAMAARLGLPVFERRLDGRRAADAALEHLERRLFVYPDEPYRQAAPAVTVFGANSRTAEVRALCDAVLALAREGVRYRDMAVLVSDMDAYAGTLARVCAARGLPLFLDTRRPVGDHAAARLLLCAVRAVAGGFAAADMIDLVKTGYAGVSHEDAELFENHVLRFGVRFSRFLAPFTRGEAPAVPEAVRQAVREHCVKTNRDGAPYFAWSVDLAGNSDVYDEPPGSLQLLAELGFCEKDDPVWQNTVAMIRAPEYRYSFAGCPIAEIGCPHAPHPWLLSVANSLLCGRVEQSLAILRASPMDNGIACESIDEVTGECTTGEAFATCAGFVCYALRRALKGGEEDA